MANAQEKLLILQEVAKRGLQDSLKPEQRAVFDEAHRRGLIDLGGVELDFPALQGSELEAQRAEQEKREAVIRAAQPGASFGEKALGAGETALTAVTGLTGGLFGQALGSVEGIIKEAVSGNFGTSDAADRIEKLAMERAQQLTFMPRTEEGQKQTKAFGEAVAPLAAVPPLAELQAVGGALSRSAARPAGADHPRVSSILSASEKNNVPIMTSDIFPPESFMGRSFQMFSEKLGPLGTGSARQSQQRARVSAVDAFAEGIDLDTPFAESMVRSINKKSAKRMENAGRVRDSAIAKLDEFGEFGSTNAVSTIDDILDKQSRLGATANSQLTRELEAFKSELLNPSDFSLKKDIRTQLIKKIKAFGRAEDTAPAADLQAVKSALDKDLTNFARANDKASLRNWLSSNREFADELSIIKDTEIKRILQSGEATPEKVIPILRGGKPSELNRLYGALGDKGKGAAKGAILQQALKDSKYFEVDTQANPNALANALNKPNMQQAVKVFFKGKDKKEIDGFTRLLDTTKRAQEGQFAPRTGESLLLPGAGTGLGIGVGTGALPLEPTIAALTAGSALIKAYESRPFRSLLIRLSNTKKGSKAEKQAIDLMIPYFSGVSTAAREQQQKTELSE
jgi:hypothetical protein